MLPNVFFLFITTYLIILSTLKGVQGRKGNISDWFVPRYEIDGKDICSDLLKNPKILILVASSPHKEGTRNAIRNTWGTYANRSDIALGFVVGFNKIVTQNFSREAKSHDDLIHGNFIDSYNNLTLKTFTMLDWAEKFCSKAKFLLKIDEDMFLNPRILLEFTRSKLNASMTIWGNIVYFSLPIRNENYTNYISADEYPAPIFPPFASGPIYLMTADCISPLKDTAMHSGFMCLEDVFITGVTASIALINRVFEKEFSYSNNPDNVCSPLRRIAVHKVHRKMQYVLWKRVTNSALYCSPHTFHFTQFLQYLNLTEHQKLKLEEMYQTSFIYKSK